MESFSTALQVLRFKCIVKCGVLASGNTFPRYLFPELVSLAVLVIAETLICRISGSAPTEQ